MQKMLKMLVLGFFISITSGVAHDMEPTEKEGSTQVSRILTKRDLSYEDQMHLANNGDTYMQNRIVELAKEEGMQAGRDRIEEQRAYGIMLDLSPSFFNSYILREIKEFIAKGWESAMELETEIKKKEYFE